MICSQIYLTENERDSLKSISNETGRSQSDLIREAVDVFIKKISKKCIYVINNNGRTICGSKGKVMNMKSLKCLLVPLRLLI